MSSKQVQALIKTISTGDPSQFKDFIKYFKEMDFLNSKDSIDFDKIKDNVEKCYYLSLSRLLLLMRFNEFSQLINYSDKLGLFIEVKKIPFRLKIICELHLDGMRKGLTGRIFEVIRFFNEYNLFELSFSKKELEIIEDIKKNDKALCANLKVLFGHLSNSLIFYSCKIMPYDLYLNFVKRVVLNLNNESRPELIGRFNLNSLKNWTD